MVRYVVMSMLLFSPLNFALEQAQNENEDIFKDETEDYMYSLRSQINPGQTWRHYKNKDYRIIAVSCHSEDLTWYVVYEALYDNPVSKIWHRPLEMFLEEIEIDGEMTPRFKRIE